MLNSDYVKDLSPSQILSRLADQARYVTRESTLYRLLRITGQMSHRRLERAPSTVNKPSALVVTKVYQIFSWVTTYLPALARVMHYYLYVFLDIYSRKIRRVAGL